MGIPYYCNSGKRRNIDPRNALERIKKKLVLVKILKIFRLYFCGKIGHKNVFHDIVEKKNAFSKYENKELKTTKN